MQMNEVNVKMAVKNWWGQRALALVCEGSRLLRGQVTFIFKGKFSPRYHGSHCDSEINFNAPLWQFCVTLPLPFSLLFFFWGGWGGWVVSTHCSLLSQSCCDDIRADTCACGAPEPRKPEHMEKKDWWRGGLHKRFITNVSNPLLHCQGDVIKHTL